jgi:hypothetical protein
LVSLVHPSVRVHDALGHHDRSGLRTRDRHLVDRQTRGSLDHSLTRPGQSRGVAHDVVSALLSRFLELHPDPQRHTKIDKAAEDDQQQREQQSYLRRSNVTLVLHERRGTALNDSRLHRMSWVIAFLPVGVLCGSTWL